VKFKLSSSEPGKKTDLNGIAMINFAAQSSGSITNEIKEPSELPNSISADRSPERTNKPRIAGILLICVFLFLIFTVINTSIGTYLILNPSGATSLEGRVEDGDGEPVEGVKIFIDDGSEFAAVTDMDGEYKISNISAGEHKFKFYKPGYRVLIVRDILYSKDALDQNGLETNEINVPSYLPGGASTGYFKGPYILVKDNELKKSNITGYVKDDKGDPLANVNISVEGTGSSVKSGGNGRFEFENITAGVHEITAVNGTGSNAEVVKIIKFIKPGVTSNIEIEFDNNSINNEIDETEDKYGTVRGKVTNDQQDPIVGAEVWLDITLSSSNYSREILTDNDGGFEFNDIPVGIYNLSASTENYYINISSNITVETNIVIVENFELEEHGSPVKATADLVVIYYCMTGLVIIAVIALLGGISAYHRKRYGLAFAGAVLSIGPAILLYTDSCICGAAVIAVVAFLLIVLSKSEFEPPKME
jgi:hypothetical protein